MVEVSKSTAQTQLALALRLSSLDEECGNEDWAALFRSLCRHRPHRRHLDFTDFTAAVRRESRRHPDTPLGQLPSSTIEELWKNVSSMRHGELRVGLADFIRLLSDLPVRQQSERDARRLLGGGRGRE